MHRRLLYTVVITLVWIAPRALQGQTPDAAMTFRHAQAFEQAGDHERASQLYGELWRNNPANPMYFEGYRRMLLQLKRYDEAVAVITERLATAPEDFALRAQLGTTLYRAGREKEALETWSQILSQGPASPQRFRVVAGVLAENRLLERSADAYRRGRVALGDDDLFTVELAQLLVVTMDYRGATEEYLRWLRKNPAQLSFIQSRLGAFTWKEEGRSAAVAAVQEAKLGGDDLRLQELLAWLYMEGKQFDLALEVTRNIELASNAGGKTLYAFAERAYREAAYAVAAKAYAEAAAIPLTGVRLAAARYGYALAMADLERGIAEEAEAGLDVSSQKETASPSGALAAFRRVLDEFPGTEYAARALFQIGRLQFERMFDLDGAISSFTRAAAEYGQPGPLRYELALRTGEVLVAKGDTAQAAQRFRFVATASDALPDQTDEALFRVAEIEYFGCRFDSALGTLEAITLNPRADYANDALALKAFLQEQRGAGDAPVRLMARADLMARKHAFTEAATTAWEVVRRYPSSPSADDALLRAAGWEETAGNTTAAATTYDRLLTDYRETSPLLDRALFRLAQLFERSLRDRNRAIAAYERLLSEFPNSVLVTETRRHIRRLRGDVL